MTYWMLAVAALMFGMYNVFIKLSSDHIQAVLGAVVLQFVAAFVGLGLLFYISRTGNEPLYVSSRGVTLAVLAGVAIGAVEILTFFVYGRGIPVAVGNPLIIGGSLVVTTSVGVIALRESVNVLQVAGVLFIMAGVAFLAWGAARAGAA